MADTTPLPIGATLGILGGGQLGRMIALDAARMGLKVHVFAPAGDAPAIDVAPAATRAPYDDVDAVAGFAAACDVVTFEFENVPAAALAAAARRAPLRPGSISLERTADRLVEKRFVEGLGLSVATFAPVDDKEDLPHAASATGLPAILKTRRMGYDGKGQVRIEGDAALADVPVAAPSVLERVVAFRREISVIAARGLDGRIAAFEPGENRHETGILRTTRVPAGISAERADEARSIAARIAEALDHVGVIGVELFETDAGLVVNEIAPRVHNSGHWTQDGADVSQFEQHVRAICGWPLGNPRRRAAMCMENLIGDDIARVADLRHQDGVVVHLYGKAEVRPGRKMGHVNRRLGPE